MICFHKTKDADITLEVNRTIYSLEIEIRSLLSKKKRLEEKVSFMNEKSGDNWYFVVSNQNLVKKDRTIGRVTTRKGVTKILRKIAKN